MTLFDELRIFIRYILHCIYSLVGFSVFFFVFGIDKITILGKDYLLPLPTGNSFSVLMFNKVRADLLPSGVQLVVTNPMSAFVSQITLSILLAFLVNVPFFLYKFILYLQPALRPQERRAVLLAILPMVLLFFSGCLFSYFFLIPATFKILYPYATVIGALPLFALDEFIYYVCALMVAVGLMFLLPLFMILLSIMGIIEPDFWKRKWRYALLFFLISSAIITPDGTGITMIMLFLPLVALYSAGYIFAYRLSQKI